jgi:DNA replication protein DnaC
MKVKEMNDFEMPEGIRRRRNGPMIEEMRKREAAFKESALERWLNSVPKAHHGFSIDNIKKDQWGGKLDRAEVVQVMRYVQSGGSRFMLLQGPEGTGKSTLAVTIFSELVKKNGKKAKHYVVPQLLSAFSFPRDGEDPLGDASKVPFLVLDDMGAGNGEMTPHQQRSMWALIDARWSNPELRTIITTNMSQNDQREGMGLRSWLGTAAWARVADDLTQITIKGDSFRGRGEFEGAPETVAPVGRTPRSRPETVDDAPRGFTKGVAGFRSERRNNG